MAVAQVVEVVMPRLSDSMEEGTIVRWLVAAGAEVAVGDVVAEIETDKATMEYEAEDAGVLEPLTAEGDSVAVGAPIARLHPAGTAGEDFAATAPPPDAEHTAPPTPADAVAGATAPSNGNAPSPDRPDGRVAATPVARRLAAELGVDLVAVAPTGRRGQVMKADVLAAAEGAPPAAEKPDPAATPEGGRGPADGVRGAVEVDTLSRLQRAVATRMAQSRATVPDFDVEMDIDMAACVALREQLREHAERPPSINDFIIKACAIALREHPRMNASFREATFERFARVNIGIAVTTDDGLVVPVITDVDQKSVGTIAAEARALAGRVRDKSITPPELAGATFTVSNLGMFGVTRFTAVIDAPQAAILAVGAVEERAVVRDGAVVAAPVMTATLACDHRIVYGADAAKFLAHVRELLQAPMRILL